MLTPPDAQCGTGRNQMIYKISHFETILCHFYNKEQKDNADRKNIQLNIEQCDVELTIACFQEFGLQLFPTV